MKTGSTPFTEWLAYTPKNKYERTYDIHHQMVGAIAAYNGIVSAENFERPGKPPPNSLLQFAHRHFSTRLPYLLRRTFS